MVINSSHKLPVLAGGCALLFIAGMVQLLLLRFEAGDVYPPYSSLRSDPLGTQVLFESVASISDDPVERNYNVLDRVDLGAGTTVLVSGLAALNHSMRRPHWPGLLHRLNQRGGRLVVTFRPDSRIKTTGRTRSGDESTEPMEPGDGNGTEPADVPGSENAYPDPEDVDTDNWRGLKSLGVSLELATDKPEVRSALRSAADDDLLPPEISWPAPHYFETPGPAWQAVYRWQDKPVVIRRVWGRGVLIMMADSYLLSNEALNQQRQTGLIAWILGLNHRIIFDEFHHGLVRSPGIATLARKYRLQGVLGAFFLLAILFFWRQATVFCPSPAQDQPLPASAAPGLNTHEGLVNLMQRHIDADQLLQVCYDIWHRSCGGRVSDAKTAQIRSLIQAADMRDPGPVYRDICELLKRGNDT